jgi:hypothetical protein
MLSAQPNNAPAVPLDADRNADKKSAPNKVVNDLQNPLQPAVVSSIPSIAPNPTLNTDPVLVSVPHSVESTSTKVDAASTSSSTSTNQGVLPAAAPEGNLLATGITIPDSTAEQFIALTQIRVGLPLAGQASVSSLNRTAEANRPATSGAIDKDGIIDASSDLSATKPHAASASGQAGSQTGSQGTTSSGDQSQTPVSSQGQGQNAAPAQMAVPDHSATTIAHAQSSTNASQVQIPPALPGAIGHAAGAPDNTASASSATPLALPVIDTAKLIQTMGQTEMRVGMRTNEFGNITISTSATRDSISAQISLDHGELAKVLAMHLPEMQMKLAGNQTVDVRIDMTGQGTGHGEGTAGGSSNGSADQSRGDSRQAGNAASSYSPSSVFGQQFSPIAASTASSEARLAGRLDIRV